MTVRDTDCWKAAQAYRRQLDTSRACFHAIVTRSADGVLVLDSQGMICFANPAAQTLLNRSAEELLGEIFGVPLSAGDVAEIELVRRDGGSVITEMHVVETEWQDRPAYLATLRDITEHKQKERRAHAAVRRRDEFIAMLSHELRNPLAAIDHAVGVLRKPDLAPAAFEQTRSAIERQCSQMRRLLGDLLDASQVTQGKIRIERAPLDLTKLVIDVTASHRPMMESRLHDFRVHVPDEPLSIDADRARIVQVISNLLSNAARYTPDGRVIEVELRREPDDFALLVVRDEGIGIEPEMLESIFEPFVQVGRSLDRNDTGLGIGLALVRNLVQMHGGEAAVHSDGLGHGSEFRVRLPLIPVRESDPPHRFDGARTASLLRILIVEDNADVREMLKLLLEMDGHAVQAAADGQAALDLLELQTPDVALVDIGLPIVDGFEFARRVRLLPQGDRIHLVALTGYGQADDRRQTDEAGFDRHLVKPVDYGKLCRTIAELANSRSARRCEPNEAATT